MKAYYRITREIDNGVKWLEANGGEFDFAYHPEFGWVSINREYVENNGHCSVGIRWELTEHEIRQIPQEDRDWILTNTAN